MCYKRTMIKSLQSAIEKAVALPEAEQEQLAREILERIDSLSELRVEIQRGLRQLEAGEGRELDIEDVIARARREHAKG